MPRRKIGLTPAMQDGILHWDRLSDIQRKNLAYDSRVVLQKALDDIVWLLRESPESFKRARDHKFSSPLEPILPSDPKKVYLTLDMLDRWIMDLQGIRAAVVVLGNKAFNIPRQGPVIEDKEDNSGDVEIKPDAKSREITDWTQKTIPLD